jgi:hypothetical protein
VRQRPLAMAVLMLVSGLATSVLALIARDGVSRGLAIVGAVGAFVTVAGYLRRSRDQA